MIDCRFIAGRNIAKLSCIDRADVGCAQIDLAGWLSIPWRGWESAGFQLSQGISSGEGLVGLKMRVHIIRDILSGGLVERVVHALIVRRIDHVVGGQDIAVRADESATAA